MPMASFPHTNKRLIAPRSFKSLYVSIGSRFPRQSVYRLHLWNYTMGSVTPVSSLASLKHTALFEPLELGKWHLQHRIVQVSISRSNQDNQKNTSATHMNMSELLGLS